MQKKFIWNFAGNARKWTSLQTTFSWGKLRGKIIWREYLKYFNIWREHSRYLNIWGEYSRYFTMRTEYFNSLIFLQESCLGRNRGADRESPGLSISSYVNISMGAFVGACEGLVRDRNWGKNPNLTLSPDICWYLNRTKDLKEDIICFCIESELFSIPIKQVYSH